MTVPLMAPVMTPPVMGTTEILTCRFNTGDFALGNGLRHLRWRNPPGINGINGMGRRGFERLMVALKSGRRREGLAGVSG